MAASPPSTLQTCGRGDRRPSKRWPHSATRSSYELGDKVSPWLASTRPLRYVLIHVSEQSRNARISDPRALWLELFAPILGAFETLKEDHLPAATINDLQLGRAVPTETRVLILPHESELTAPQRSALHAFTSAGGVVVRLDADRGWHRKSEKPELKRRLRERLAAAAAPPIRARGPAAMHAVFFRKPASTNTVVCLVNDFGWFRSEREAADTPRSEQAPPPGPCTNVVLEIPSSQPTVRRAFEAVTGKELAVRRESGKTEDLRPRLPSHGLRGRRRSSISQRMECHAKCKTQLGLARRALAGSPTRRNG